MYKNDQQKLAGIQESFSEIKIDLKKFVKVVFNLYIATLLLTS